MYRNIYNKMPWHNNSISVGEVQAASATAASGEEPTETPGVNSGANGRLSQDDLCLEVPHSPAEVIRERPVAIVFGMKRSPRMNRFGEGLTRAAGAEEVGLPREILATKKDATAESFNTKIMLESEETSVPIPKSIAENGISGCLPPPQSCVCGSSCRQSVEEVMTLPIVLQWKGDIKGECISSASTNVKSEVFSEGTMKTFSSYSVDSPDVVLRETLV